MKLEREIYNSPNEIILGGKLESYFNEIEFFKDLKTIEKFNNKKYVFGSKKITRFDYLISISDTIVITKQILEKMDDESFTNFITFGKWSKSTISDDIFYNSRKKILYCNAKAILKTMELQYFNLFKLIPNDIKHRFKSYIHDSLYYVCDNIEFFEYIVDLFDFDLTAITSREKMELFIMPIYELGEKISEIYNHDALTYWNSFADKKPILEKINDIRIREYMIWLIEKKKIDIFAYSSGFNVDMTYFIVLDLFIFHEHKIINHPITFAGSSYITNFALYSNRFWEKGMKDIIKSNKFTLDINPYYLSVFVNSITPNIIEVLCIKLLKKIGKKKAHEILSKNEIKFIEHPTKKNASEFNIVDDYIPICDYTDKTDITTYGWDYIYQKILPHYEENNFYVMDYKLHGSYLDDLIMYYIESNKHKETFFDIYSNVYNIKLKYKFKYIGLGFNIYLKYNKLYLKQFEKSKKMIGVMEIFIHDTEDNMGHSNKLIIDKNKKKIYIIEPHGKKINPYISVQDYYIEQIKIITSAYRFPLEYLYGEINFQTKANANKKIFKHSGGTCAAWSSWIASFYLDNYNISYKKQMEILKKMDSIELSIVISKYIQNIMIERNKLYKTIYSHVVYPNYHEFMNIVNKN